MERRSIVYFKKEPTEEEIRKLESMNMTFIKKIYLSVYATDQRRAGIIFSYDPNYLSEQEILSNGFVEEVEVIPMVKTADNWQL